MIPIICHGRVDLAQCQIRMLEMHLFWAPAIGHAFDNQLNNFGGCTFYHGHTSITENNMLIGCLCHCHTQLPVESTAVALYKPHSSVEHYSNPTRTFEFPSSFQEPAYAKRLCLFTTQLGML